MIYKILPIVLPIVSILIAVCVAFFVLKRIKNKTNAEFNISSVEQSGSSVPIAASFVGLKWLPSLIALAHNSINPSLTLFDDHIEYGKSMSTYENIESVNIFEWRATENIMLSFKNTSWTYSANLMKRDNLIQLLKFFGDKDVLLSEKAKLALI